MSMCNLQDVEKLGDMDIDLLSGVNINFILLVGVNIKLNFPLRGKRKAQISSYGLI